MGRRILIAVLAAIFAILGSYTEPVCAEVIISEIMYNPQGADVVTTVVPNINREWVELYNTGPSDVDLSGWQFGDSQDGDWASPFPAGTIIGASQALVVTGDTATFDLEWGSGINRVAVTGFPTLANSPSPTNETAAIRDNTSLIRDFVNFDEANGWPRVDGSDGQGIFLLPQALTSAGNNVGTNWKPAVYGVYGAKFRNADTENHGSPGYVATIPQAPFAPSPDAAWSMVVMPDTQNYVKSSVDNPILTLLTKWIRDHKQEYKIQLAMTEGDIVNNNNTNNPSGANDVISSQQWANAKTSFSILDGQVPYIMASGNHDYGFTNADNRDTMINNYFKATDNPLNDPAKGGILKGTKDPGDLTNAYYAFTAPDGRKMLILTLEWEPRPAAVAWGNQIAALPQFADYTATLLTHQYLEGNNTRSASTNVAADASGEELWQGLVRTNQNFQMTFNGHFGGDGAGYLVSTSNANKLVHQMFLNSQFETYGGDGWIRLVEFLNDGKTVRVRTYSPFLGLERTSSDFAFEFEVTPLDFPGGSFIAGDFNHDGIVDTRDYIAWRKSEGAFGYYATDANGDHQVNQVDYAVWRANFGHAAGSGADELAGVPEPASAVMMLLVSMVATVAHIRRR
jgi:hypothetical protein